MTGMNKNLDMVQPFAWAEKNPSDRVTRLEARHVFGTYAITRDADDTWQVSPVPLGSENGGLYEGRDRAIEAAKTDYAVRFNRCVLASCPDTSPLDRPAAREALTEALSGALDCTRVWEAWGVGTMTEDDFTEVASDDARLDDIIDAVAAPLLSEIAVLRAELAALTKAHDTVCGALVAAVRAEALSDMARADSEAGLI